MLDINKLAEGATGEVTLLQVGVNPRITVRHGKTVVDIHGDSAATYADGQYFLGLEMVTQKRASELVRGASV